MPVEPKSYSKDVKPLFRQRDIDCMNPFGVLLDDFNYMSDPTGDGVFADHANGRHVYARLTGEEHPGCRKVDHIGQI